MATTNLKAEMKERADRKESAGEGREGGRDRGGDRDDDRGGRRGGGFGRRKVCRFCADQDFVMDYKDQRMMQSFITEHGKIVPRRISGNCATHQRKLTTHIKRARNIALVGYVSMGG
jgi:small subunit ribosomal protein S18